MVKRNAAPVGRRRAPVRSADILKSRWFTLVAFAVIVLALIALFSDFLFSNEMLYGSDMIQAGVFFRTFLVEHVAEHGAVPQWNPYIFSGMPFVEAFHGDIFYPFSMLKFVVPMHRAYGYTFFLHLLGAAFFMYLCARQFKLQRLAALIAGVAYMSAPYLVSFITPGHDGKIFVTTLFPLVMLFLDRGFETRPFLNFSLLGLTIGLIILTPHPQMAYFTLWALSLYAAFKIISTVAEQKSVVPVLKPTALTVYAVAIGLLISAIQFYPGYIYTSDFSPRAADDSKSGWDWATSWSMHEEEAMGILIPEFAGANLRGEETAYWGKNAFKDNSESVSVVAFFLALLGLFVGRRKETWFFVGLAAFALFYALGSTTPLFHLFYLIPKVASLRAPSMIMFLFSFSIAMLAGMAVNQLIVKFEKEVGKAASVDVQKREKRITNVLFGFPIIMLVLAFLFTVAGKGMIDLWSGLFYDDISRPIQQGISKLDLAYRNLPAIQSGAWFAFLASALTAALIWLYRTKRVGAVALAGIAAIILVNGVRFNSRFVETVDYDQVFRYGPVQQFLDNQADFARTTNLTSPQDNQLPLFHNYVPYGYHGNQLRWYDQLAGGPAMSSAFNPRFLNLTGVTWMLIPSNQRLPNGFPGPEPTPIVATFGRTSIVRNDNALPRVYLADTFKVFPDREQIYDPVLNGTDNLEEIVYLEEQPSPLPDNDTTPGDSAWIVAYMPDTVRIQVNTDSNKLLVLTDNWFDAWKATIDGEPVDVLRAYGTFRALAVPPGQHTIEMWFESERYATGRLVTLLTSLFLLAVLGFYGFKAVLGRTKAGEEES